MAWGKKKAAPGPAAGSGLDWLVRELELRTGFKLENAANIPPGVTFRQWCEELGQKGLKVDGKPFRLDDRPAMAWIYDQVPSTEDEAYRLVLVLMKCAQVGFTVMEMLAGIYLGLRFGPATVGMFLPDMNLAGLKSTERFMPIVRSVPDVHKLMTQDSADGRGRTQGEGNVNRRRIGDALFVFSWTSGRATTESVPMDVLSFDEVQEMTIEQMEKTLERLSASAVRFTLMGSTANWPDADIHFWYKRGSRHRFKTTCPTCGVSEPIDEYFPNCFRFGDNGVHRYTCRAGHVIDNPQVGAWMAENPAADPPVDPTIPKKDRPLRIRSIHFPQFLSPDISPTEIWDAYRFAESMKNFYNRKLGKPYLDPSQVPVTLEHLREAERQGVAAGLTWLTRARGCFMGIDQMGNFNVVVIKRRMPDGRQAIVHLEEVYSADPFERCSELMRSFDVAVCVVEINPNYNDAKRFAQRHPGRVFICDSFGTVAEGMIQWGDAPRLDTSERRTSEEARDRYTLRMDQFKCMQVSMARFTNTDRDGKPQPLCLFPDSQALVQEVKESGVAQQAAVAPRMWHHLTKTALVVETSAEDKKKGIKHFKRTVRKIGIDPHFSYANMLCDVAWSRAHGTTLMMIPPVSESAMVNPVDDARVLVNRLPAAQASKVIEVLSTGPARGTCGTCAARMGDQCTERGFTVQTTDMACDIYEAEA